jgi:hypothetical protein
MTPALRWLLVLAGLPVLILASIFTGHYLAEALLTFLSVDLVSHEADRLRERGREVGAVLGGLAGWWLCFWLTGPQETAKPTHPGSAEDAASERFTPPTAGPDQTIRPDDPTPD